MVFCSHIRRRQFSFSILKLTILITWFSATLLTMQHYYKFQILFHNVKITLNNIFCIWEFYITKFREQMLQKKERKFQWSWISQTLRQEHLQKNKQTSNISTKKKGKIDWFHMHSCDAKYWIEPYTSKKSNDFW